MPYELRHCLSFGLAPASRRLADRVTARDARGCEARRPHPPGRDLSEAKRRIPLPGGIRSSSWPSILLRSAPNSSRRARSPSCDRRGPLVAATATAAVHDCKDHDGHQSSQRGTNPKGSARDRHSTTSFHLLDLAHRDIRLSRAEGLHRHRSVPEGSRRESRRVAVSCLSAAWRIVFPVALQLPEGWMAGLIALTL